ncbi:MAG: hypothetical protein K5886_01600 [Lachnospiraceae bacterium]|nr:hypothetical protein [Lachnospiraceae bacterium]
MKTAKKRLSAIVMTVVLTIPLTIGCIGCGSKGEENLGVFKAAAKNGVIDLHQAGIKITLPDSLKDKQDRIAATPTTYFVDSEGKILESDLGSRSEGSWEDMLEKHLQIFSAARKSYA